jgi:hypothetical protein
MPRARRNGRKIRLESATKNQDQLNSTGPSHQSANYL